MCVCVEGDECGGGGRGGNVCVGGERGVSVQKKGQAARENVMRRQLTQHQYSPYSLTPDVPVYC